MSRFVYVAAASLALVALQSAASAKDKPQMTALQLQSIQTHDFEAAKDQVFGSVMSVLQDSGYRIQNGDLQTGLITGIGSSKGKLTYNLLWGFGKSKKAPVVSAFIEQIGVVTRVRLNFVMAKMSSNEYGAQPQDEEPITDAEVYRDAFEKIEQALFVRQSMTAPTPVPAAPVVAPAAPAAAPPASSAALPAPTAAPTAPVTSPTPEPATLP